jgi:hypothetical protein
MAKGKKGKRKKRKATKGVDFSKPIDIHKVGSDDDPCFGKLYDLSHDTCKRCGDSELCAVVFAQNMAKQRKKLESKTKFKDILLDKEDEKENKALKKWVKKKVEAGMPRIKIIKKAKATFGSSRKEIKDIIKKIK